MGVCPANVASLPLDTEPNRILVSQAVTHFYTPYFFISTEAPRYETGAILLAVFSGLVCVTAVVIRFALKHQNRKLDRLDAAKEPYTGSLEGIPKGYRFRT